MADFDVDPSLAPAGETTTTEQATETTADTGAETTEQAEAGAETVTETAETTAAAGTEPEPQKQYRGAVAELIEKRKEAKAEREARIAAEARLSQIEHDINEGRLLRQAPRQAADAEKEALTKTAERLRLFTQDEHGNKVYDLDAAARVQAEIRETVRSEVAPVRHLTLRDKAVANKNEAIRAAKANGWDVDIVAGEYDKVLSNPNGAELLSQAEVAMTVWKQALGEMVVQGKLTAKEAKAAAAGGSTVPRTPAAIVTESGGRRAPAAAAIKLSPKVQEVYKSHGMDPAKGTFSTKELKVDKDGGVFLE